jgi:glycosyltransferase involved in cell wall biosynthesis
MPKVSIGVPVYNGERYITQAMDSLLRQDEPDLEIIVCDNASMDRTAEICQDFAARDGRIRYIRNERNIGAGPNFNLAFQLARGKYFKWAAHDDWISASYISDCVRALEDTPDAVLAFGSTQCVNEEGHPIQGTGVELQDLAGLPARERFRAIVTGSISCFEIFGVFRSSALRRTDLHQSYYGSDRALLAQIGLLGPLLKVDGPVLYNRNHSNRSVRIAGSRERLVWQDMAQRGKAPLLNWRISRHYVSLVWRCAPSGERWQSLFVLLRWLMSRHTLFVLVVDLIDAVSPQTARSFKAKALKFWRVYRAVLPTSRSGGSH